VTVGDGELFIHIGLHKTGTSYLQSVVFPELPDVHLVRGLRPLREEFGREPAGAKILISSEVLSGRPWPALRDRTSSPTSFYSNFERSLRMIAQMHPHARILVGFREQSAWLSSLYRQYLQEGGCRSLEEFINPGGRTGLLKPQDLLFAPRLKLIRELFPAPPFVFTQEQLAHDEGSLIRAMASFMGLEPTDLAPTSTGPRGRNVGVQARQASVLRFLNQIDNALRQLPGQPTSYNRFFKKVGLTPRHLCQNLLSAVPSPPFELPDELNSWVQGHCADDWKTILKAADSL